METQPDLRHPASDRLDQHLGLAFGLAVHHRVIHVSFEADAGKLLRHPRVERIVHEQISQYRRNRRTLRGNTA